jgi:cbb3-type cytochrome oxidase subunit 3
MQQQDYQNHRKMDPFYHYVLSLLVLLFFIGSLINMGMCLAKGERIFEALLIFISSLALAILFIKLRYYALRAQDRGIVAEEQLRYYILTGKRFDTKLTFKQIIALRFASDDEFPALVDKALSESLNPSAIKEAIKHWKPDHNRL